MGSKMTLRKKLDRVDVAIILMILYMFALILRN
jgi:hypothetical protein